MLSFIHNHKNKMTNKNKILMAVLAGVVVAGVALYAGNSGLFQGRMLLKSTQEKMLPAYDEAKTRPGAVDITVEALPVNVDAKFLKQFSASSEITKTHIFRLNNNKYKGDYTSDYIPLNGIKKIWISGDNLEKIFSLSPTVPVKFEGNNMVIDYTTSSSGFGFFDKSTNIYLPINPNAPIGSYKIKIENVFGGTVKNLGELGGTNFAFIKGTEKYFTLGGATENIIKIY